jgi:hypothetical protein
LFPHQDAGRLDAAAKLPQEADAVIVGPENIGPPVAAEDDVLERIGEVDTGGRDVAIFILEATRRLCKIDIEGMTPISISPRF